jgi:hypothetical protein
MLNDPQHEIDARDVRQSRPFNWGLLTVAAVSLVVGVEAIFTSAPVWFAVSELAVGMLAITRLSVRAVKGRRGHRRPGDR